MSDEKAQERERYIRARDHQARNFVCDMIAQSVTNKNEIQTSMRHLHRLTKDETVRLWDEAINYLLMDTLIETAKKLGYGGN